MPSSCSRLCAAFSIALLFLALSPRLALAAGDASYANLRYGFSLSWPAGDYAVREADNGDGITVTDGQGLELRAWGSNSPGVLNESFSDVLKAQKQAVLGIAIPGEYRLVLPAPGLKGADLAGEGIMDLQVPAALHRDLVLLLFLRGAAARGPEVGDEQGAPVPVPPQRGEEGGRRISLKGRRLSFSFSRSQGRHSHFSLNSAASREGRASTYSGTLPRKITFPPASRKALSASRVVDRMVSQAGTITAS